MTKGKKNVVVEDLYKMDPAKVAAINNVIDTYVKHESERTDGFTDADKVLMELMLRGVYKPVLFMLQRCIDENHDPERTVVYSVNVMVNWLVEMITAMSADPASAVATMLNTLNHLNEEALSALKAALTHESKSGGPEVMKRPTGPTAH